MSVALALSSITPKYGELRLKNKVSSQKRLLRTICTYKWSFAKRYLETRPDIIAVQAGHHISQWEWWVVRTEIGYLQCTLFKGKIMEITPFMEDIPCYEAVESPVVSPAPIAISG